MGRARQIILANAFEAIIGALYLDQGFVAAEGLVRRTLLKELPDIISAKKYRDAKSLFQEAAQEKRGVTPSYALLSEQGPDHAKQFKVGVYLGTELIADGEGNSKQEAEQEAARAGLSRMGWQQT
jgi:ribonuclease-3